LYLIKKKNEVKQSGIIHESHSTEGHYLREGHS